MTNENLYLIGTAHIDLDGPKRLEGLLTQISPDVVALEFHKDREALMQERKSVDPKEEERQTDEILTEVGLSLTPEQRRVILDGGREMNSVMGYEFNVSKAYADANPKSRLEYIDISLFENGVQEFKDGYIWAMKGMLATIAQEPELKEPFLEMLSKGKYGFLQQSRDGVEMIYKNAEMMEELAEFMRDPETVEAMKEQMPPQTFEAMKQIYHPKRDKAMASRIRELYDGGNQRVAAVTGLLHVPGLKSRILDLDPKTITLADYRR